MSTRHLTRRSFFSRNIRKSVSWEPLVDVSSSEDEDRGGGARLSTCSLTPSPAGKQSMLQGKLISEVHGSPGSSINSFQVGANSDDDVFAGPEPSISFNGGTATLVYRPKSNTQSYDAQNHYPQKACVFVANLYQKADDEELEYEVTRVFSQFGVVYVKIKRDHRRGMPHAFCQFTCAEDAERAEREGKGIVILGRPCRTEMTRGQATFIVYKTSGQPTYPEEAIRLLEKLGAISKAERLPVSIQQALRIGPAILVEFEMFDTERDVIGSLRGHKSFRVIPYDPKFAPTERHEQRDASAVAPSHGSRLARDAMIDYDRDRRSVYMGNLPCSMTADRLESIVKGCGVVLSIELKRKPIADIHEKFTCFAFVEYDRPDSADTLVKTLNQVNIDGHIIRVSRKESRTFRASSTVKSETLRPSTQGAFARHRPRPGFNRPHARDIFKTLQTEEDTASGVSLDRSHERYPQPSDRMSADENHAHGNTSQTDRATTPGVKARNMATLDTPRPRDVQEAPMSPPFTMPHFPSPHPYMPWMAPYSPHSFAPVSPYGTIPAQGPPTMMYPGVFSSPIYPGMYPDVYGFCSPIPAMGAPLGGEEAVSDHNTPTRSGQDKGGKEATGAEKECSEEGEKKDTSS